MEWMRRHLVECPSFAMMGAKLHRMCDEMLKDDIEYMRLERYVEPLERRELSLTTRNEAFDGFFRRFIVEKDVSLEVCGVSSECVEECGESSAPAEAFGSRR